MKWRNIVGKTLTAVLMLIVLVAVAGYFYLRSSSFQQFAIRKVVEQADLATGGNAEIGGLDFDLSTLTAHLYNITLQGTEAREQPPLLHADELTVRIKVLSVLRRQVTLQELLIAHPVIHLQVNRQGNNNLPSAPASSSSSHTSVFDLAIGHAQITNGEIDYNDRKTPLDANLYHLETDIHFESLAKRYDGSLSYDNGIVHYAQYEPFPHALNLAFSATPEQFNLQSATLKIASSSVVLNAELSNYANPVVDGDYQIQMHTQDFASLSPDTAPAGDVSLAGKVHYRAVANKPLQDVSIDGHLTSRTLTAVASGKRVELQRLEGSYQLAGGNLQVSDLSFDTLGGNIIANAAIKHLDTTPESRIKAGFKNISLKALQRSLHQPLQVVSLSGNMNGKMEAAWKGSIDNLRAQSDLTVRALASSKSNPSSEDVPVNGEIHMAYNGAGQTIRLRQTTLRIPSATITTQGEISNHSSLQVQLTANDLHQLTQLASSFSSMPAKQPSVSGSATLNAMIHGSIKKPAITAQLNAQNLQVEGSEWKNANLQMQANPSAFIVQSGSLVNAHRGQATFSANVNLQNWSYQPSNSIRAHLDVQQMRVADLQRLANQQLPISGDLSAKLALEGSELNPSGSGSLQLANGQAYGEPIKNLSVKFNAGDGSIASTLNLAIPAGALDANLTFTPKTKAYKVKLDAPSVLLQKLQTVQAKNLPITGTVSVSMNGEGTLDDPQLAAIVSLPQLQVQQNSISGIKAELHVAQHYADLNVDSIAAQAPIHARGRVALTGNYDADLAIDTGTIPLGAVVATYAPSVPMGFQGETELHATLKGPLKDKSQIEAHLSIPVFKASYQALQIGIANPIRADYANSVVTLQPAEIRGTDTSLNLQGKLPLAGPTSPSLSAQGSIDVRILKIFDPNIDSSGTLALDVHASGSTAQPAVQGQIQLKEISIITADAPVGIEKLNGILDITSDHVQFTKMTGQVGGGPVSIGGSIMYRPNLQFNLALQGKSVRLRYPVGLRSLLDANLAFSGTPQVSTLNGRVLIDSLAFTSDFDLSKFTDQFSGGNTLSQPGFADTINLSIAVQSQENLSASNSQVTIEGQAALRVGGTAANPVITGRTTLTSGELFYRNVRYQLQNGIISFNNPNETKPVLNISVTTTVEQYNLTLTMRGTLDKLTTSYVSDPPLATADVINLIARGQTTEESSATTQSTDSMIASQAASQLASGLQNFVGISSLQIDPSQSGSGQNTPTQIAIQQRVTKNFLFTFSTDVSQPGSEVVGGEYQIDPHWSVSATRDQLGGVSVDGRYHTRF